MSAGARLAAAKAAKAPEKSPADLAGEAFGKLYSDKEAKLSQERFTQVIAAGLDFLTKYPTHWRANNVIKDLAFFHLHLALLGLATCKHRHAHGRHQQTKHNHHSLKMHVHETKPQSGPCVCGFFGNAEKNQYFPLLSSSVRSCF